MCAILFLNASSYCAPSYFCLFAPSPGDTPTLQMATNYLKAQFAMPHHTVPTLEDTQQVAVPLLRHYFILPFSSHPTQPFCPKPLDTMVHQASPERRRLSVTRAQDRCLAYYLTFI